MHPPSGTVTFLFTDIEGSTRLWEEHSDEMRVLVAQHDERFRAAIELNGGYVFATGGDGFAAAFDRAADAVAGAEQCQAAIADLAEIKVRMGINTGEVHERGGDYFGPPVNRTARLMAAGHGGQVLLSAVTAELVPGLKLRNLGEHRLRDIGSPLLVWQLGMGEFPPLRSLETGLGNLPALAKSFVGRDTQIAALREALGAHRLVTLVGVGGVGKTSLALHAAASMSGDYRDGTWFVELAPVLDAADLTEAFAAVFAVAPSAGRSWLNSLVESLGARQLLVVLDNCEHVLGAAATLAEQLLARCPNVTIVATSRESLGIGGERAWPVPSLDVGTSSAASALFVERARDVEPEFSLRDDVDVVAEICRRLDGIPLAIELAAARVRSMSPAQIRERLDERFRLLTGSRRALERHRTLQNAVQWSYDLLSETEQHVLQRMSVFAGGFTLAAVTAISGDEEGLDELETLDLVDSLVRKSLVRVDRSGAELRYTMLETIRQFAEERLTESADGDAVRDRHVSYFADQAEVTFDAWYGPREALSYPFIDAEIANLRAAFRWAVDNGRADAAIRIAACAHPVARMRLRTETFGWCAEVAELARLADHPKLPQLLSGAADSAWGLGLLDEAKGFASTSIALADDRRFEPYAGAYIDLAETAFFEGEVAAGIEILRLGAAHPADQPDRLVLSAYLGFVGHVGAYLPDDEFAAALASVKEAGFPTAFAFALTGQAALVAERDVAAAIELYEEAVEILESCGNRLMELRTRAWLAGVLATSDDPERALASFTEIVDAWRVNGDTMLSAGVAHLAVLLARLGFGDGAARLYGAATRGLSLDAAIPDLDNTMTAVREAMGATEFRTALDDGAALSYAEAGELASALIAHARAEFTSNR